MHSSLRRLTRGLTGWVVDVAPSGRHEPREPGAPFGRRILEMPRRRRQRAREAAKTSQLRGDARQGRGLGGWGSADGEKSQVSVWRRVERRLQLKLGDFDVTWRWGRGTTASWWRYLRFLAPPRRVSRRRWRQHQELRSSGHFRPRNGSRREEASMPFPPCFSLSALAGPA